MSKAKFVDLTGNKYDMLTVMYRNIEAEQNYDCTGLKYRPIIWHCKCDCGKELDIRQGQLLRKSSFLHSCGCTKKRNPNYNKDKNDTNSLEWEELYDYVKRKVFNYDEDISLSPHMILRLQGLRKGKFYANNNTKSKANYSFQTILNTFMFCRSQILIANKKEFDSDDQKFNYIMKIIESKIGEVRQREINTNRMKEKIKSVDMTIATHKGAEYKRKTVDVKNKRLENMW